MKHFLICLALASVPAHALAGSEGGTDVYPGLNCSYYGPQGSDNYFDPAGYSANGLRNTSSSDRYVACPITKPFWDQDFGGMDTHSAVVTMDSDQSDACRLFRRALTTSSYGWWATTGTVRRSNGLHEHVFARSGRYSTYDYSISLYCRVPAGKYISNYQHTAYHF